MLLQSTIYVIQLFKQMQIKKIGSWMWAGMAASSHLDVSGSTLQENANVDKKEHDAMGVNIWLNKIKKNKNKEISVMELSIPQWERAPPNIKLTKFGPWLLVLKS